MTWYVLYVKPQSEKKVAEKLANIGVEVYCPLVKEIRQWSDRKKTIETPLFKSYVFVQITEKERDVVFDVAGVVRYLFWLGKPAVVRAEEIATIKEWLNNDMIDTFSVEKVKPGDEINVKDGLFKNHHAIVQEVRKNRLRLVIKGLGVIVNARIKDVV